MDGLDKPDGSLAVWKSILAAEPHLDHRHVRARHGLQLLHGLRLGEHAAEHVEEVVVAVDVGGADHEGVDVGATAVNADAVGAEREEQGRGLVDHTVGVPSLGGKALHPAVEDALQFPQHGLVGSRLAGVLVQTGFTKEHF